MPVYAYYAIDQSLPESMQAMDLLAQALNMSQEDPTSYMNTTPEEIQRAVD